MHAQRAARVRVFGEPFNQELLEGDDLAPRAAQRGGDEVGVARRVALGRELLRDERLPPRVRAVVVPERPEHQPRVLLEQRHGSLRRRQRARRRRLDGRRRGRRPVRVAAVELVHVDPLLLEQQAEEAAERRAARAARRRARAVRAPAAREAKLLEALAPLGRGRRVAVARAVGAEAERAPRAEEPLRDRVPPRLLQRHADLRRSVVGDALERVGEADRLAVLGAVGVAVVVAARAHRLDDLAQLDAQVEQVRERPQPPRLLVQPRAPLALVLADAAAARLQRRHRRAQGDRGAVGRDGWLEAEGVDEALRLCVDHRRCLLPPRGEHLPHQLARGRLLGRCRRSCRRPPALVARRRRARAHELAVARGGREDAIEEPRLRRAVGPQEVADAKPQPRRAREDDEPLRRQPDRRPHGGLRDGGHSLAHLARERRHGDGGLDELRPRLRPTQPPARPDEERRGEALRRHLLVVRRQDGLGAGAEELRERASGVRYALGQRDERRGRRLRHAVEVRADERVVVIVFISSSSHHSFCYEREW